MFTGIDLATVRKAIERSKGDHELHQAAFEGDTQRLQKSLGTADGIKHLNQPNRLGCTPLRLAATAGRVECVTLLLQEGAELDTPDVKAQTPLYVAVKNHHVDCVDLLLAAGACPDGHPATMACPLYLAAMDGFFHGVKALLRYEADPDGKRMLGLSTPLYAAMTYRHFACFRELLLAGASLTTQSRLCSGEESVYHSACRLDADLSYPQLLHDCGGSLYIRDSSNKLPRDMSFNNDCQRFINNLYESPHSLVSLCRIGIRAHLRGKLPLIESTIDTLPLPNKLKMYLKHRHLKCA